MAKAVTLPPPTEHAQPAATLGVFTLNGYESLSQTATDGEQPPPSSASFAVLQLTEPPPETL